MKNNIPGRNRIAIFGGATEGIWSCVKGGINLFKAEIVCFVDSDSYKQGLVFHRIPVIAPNRIEFFKVDYILIAAHSAMESITSSLLELGIEIERIAPFITDGILSFNLGNIEETGWRDSLKFYIDSENRREIIETYIDQYRNYINMRPFERDKLQWNNGKHLIAHAGGGFVNGIPLLFIELKKPSVDVENAYNDNYTDYLDTIPHLFYYNAFLMLSNGPEAKVGTLGSDFEFFHEWKRLREEDEGSVALETMLRGICKKENFLDLLENFILFDHSNGNLVKILARNHQYLGVNEAAKAYAARKLNNGKLGVFWHTQGSGKSYSMVFLSQKIRRTFAGSPTIVILTDRDELNTQISETFENCGLLGKGNKASRYIATSGEDLIENKLKKNPSFIFTLIQKFNKRDVQPIIPDHDIIIMSDEAHRSQYGVFAENMVHLLPTASRIGFTGTPLMSDDNITERTFGGYISIYDFKRAVDDHATVPLYYENRGERLKVSKMDKANAELNQRIAEAVEKADLDPSQEEKLEREFAKEIHVLTAEPRLRTIAKDFVGHYTDLWTSGKAMFVCLNKVTCVRMFNLAKEYWAQVIEETKQLRQTATQQEALELDRKIKWLEETEMAVVISQDQNEILTFKKWGLDIIPHREKMEKRTLDKEFKDSKNPFRVVFVCAMWLTGFDVKSLSCLYLDKPLKAHTLMQTIARANRVNEGKSNGLIIDYIGVVKALRQALATYTITKGGTGGKDPTVDKSELIKRVMDTIQAATDFLSQYGFVLQELTEAKDFKKIELIQKAADLMCASLEIKKT
ncbi:MAG: type I restriction endonuclease subunit R, partial [Aeriscardovia sp.]|nr:type I restriction endonuclease subunit R [Aeriscardovia sp.]